MYALWGSIWKKYQKYSKIFPQDLHKLSQNTKLKTTKVDHLEGVAINLKVIKLSQEIIDL